MRIYLDNNATTPVDPEVIAAVRSSLQEDYGNPSSSHLFGIASKKAVDAARGLIAALIGAEPDEVYFTSGGTESNNLALLGTARRLGGGHIITSSIEHPSVLNPLKELEQAKGFSVSYCPVGADGRVVVQELQRLIRKDTILISLMHANNETGVLQPVREVGRIARERGGILLHTDAAQSVGKVPVDVRDMNADMLTVVAHKFYGPKGVGALYVKKGSEPAPIMFGASHEGGLRPGTESVSLISGLGKAAELAHRDMEARVSHALMLRELMYESLTHASGPGVKLNGHETLRLPNTLNVSLKGADATALVEELGKKGLAFSAGAACHADRKSPSYVLKAMGVSDDDALSSIRLSVGKENTPEEIREAAELLSAALGRQGQAR